MLNKRQTAVFCSQLKSLLASGMPLLEAMTIIRDLPQSKKHTSSLKAIITRLNNGYSLSEASGELLPAMATGALSAAEQAGDLEVSLGRLADYYAGKADLDEKLIGALIYPAFVGLLSFTSIIVLIVFVIPGLKGLFSDFEATLPPITSAILATSDAFSQYWPVMVILAGLAVLWFHRIKGKDPARVEKIILKMPLVGRLYKQELIIQGFGTLGSLLSGGTPIVAALKITADSSKSRIFKDVILSSKTEIENGGRLYAAFAGKNFFPLDAVQMLQVGENSGQLDRMLSNIADFQAKERELFLKRITTLIEPAMTLIVGIVVGVVVLAMFLPLLNMVSSLQ